MQKKYKRLIKDIVPPIIIDRYKKILKDHGWYGNYDSWQEAQKLSSGYDAYEILEKVKNSLLKVKNGEAVYERDSVVFDNVEYSWPLLAGIMWVAAQNDGKLSLMDFGGSLGSSYFQNQKFLKNLKKLSWSIVEQPIFVETGKKYFENEELKFYENIDSCVKKEDPNLVLFSSVLQYLEFPYEVLKSVFSYSPEFIIVDIMPFLEKDNDRITIQKVSPKVYPASYPCWFLSKPKFLEFFFPKYELIADFQSHLSITLDEKSIVYEGFIFKKR